MSFEVVFPRRQISTPFAVPSAIFGVANLYKKLKPEGLYVKAPAFRKFIAKMYMPKFVGGWGNFFGRNPPKLGENAQMPKSRWHLRMMNKVMENE